MNLIKNYFYYLNDLRLKRKDKAYMRAKANSYNDAAIYLLRVIQIQAKTGQVLLNPDLVTHLTTAVDELLKQAVQLYEMADKK